MTQSEQPLAESLARLDAALSEVITAVGEAELSRLNATGLIEFLHGIERVRNRMAVIDTAAVVDCDRRGIAQLRKDRGTAGFLSRTLKLSSAEAHRRVRNAHATTPRTAVSGTPIDPIRPRLAAAITTGTITPEQSTVIVRALAGLDRLTDITPADLDEAEHILIDHCAAFGPADLSIVARRITDHLFPDGTLGREAVNTDRRFLSLTAHPDGGATINGRLTAVAYNELFAVLSPLADPQARDAQTATDPHNDGEKAPPEATLPGTALPGTADERTAGQRMHDALQSLCTRQLRAGTLPDSGGTPCTVMVTVNLEDLITRTGHATTSTGILSIGELLHLATEADIIPVFMNNAGGIMGYGRTKRLFTPAQTKALTARDRGCSFPTCHIPPEWCQRHHIVPWINDGLTEIDNGTLVCDYHHHQALNDGWDCTMTTDKIPAWLPPPWIDPTRAPLINPRINSPLLR